MMREFEIHVRCDAAAPLDAPVEIAIGSGETVFTRLLRQGAHAPDDHLRAPPGLLVFWLVDNWWRLRWECVPATGASSTWRLAHDLAGIGGGFAWPRLSLWGEGERVGLSSRSDPSGVVGPVRYLTDAVVYVPASAFEVEVDRLLAAMSCEQSGPISDRAALQAQIAALTVERADPDLCNWRRLEAQLGFDVDDAPDELMASLSVLQDDYGAGAVAEAAMAAQGAEAAAILHAEILAANDHHWQCDLHRTAALIGAVTKAPGDSPWHFGDIAAKAIRRAVGHGAGPLSNTRLADILGVRRKALQSVHGTGSHRPAYGLRLVTGGADGEVVALMSRWSADRRFEFSRALGDAIWSKGERLGPLTRAKSERQKFQRAFAQSLLCPHDALIAYIGHDVSDGAIAAAALYFQVSERLIRSVLVNRDRPGRLRPMDVTRLGLGREDDGLAFHEVVDAA